MYFYHHIGYENEYVDKLETKRSLGLWNLIGISQSFEDLKKFIHWISCGSSPCPIPIFKNFGSRETHTFNGFWCPYACVPKFYPIWVSCQQSASKPMSFYSSNIPYIKSLWFLLFYLYEPRFSHKDLCDPFWQSTMKRNVIFYKEIILGTMFTSIQENLLQHLCKPFKLRLYVIYW